MTLTRHCVTDDRTEHDSPEVIARFFLSNNSYSFLHVSNRCELGSSHTGDEHSIDACGTIQEYGNPLYLEIPLRRGLRVNKATIMSLRMFPSVRYYGSLLQVIAAHCATEGSVVDTDDPKLSKKECFELFERLMAKPEYQGLLFGDLAAITAMRRVKYISRILDHVEWHDRLLYGS